MESIKLPNKSFEYNLVRGGVGVIKAVCNFVVPIPEQLLMADDPPGVPSGCCCLELDAKDMGNVCCRGSAWRIKIHTSYSIPLH